MASSIRIERSLVFALMFFTAAHARAQTPELDAKAAAREGRRAFESGDFARAIEKYEVAQRLKPVPGLLFNLAQSHRRAGHLEKATWYFRGYLTALPSTPQARAIEALIQRLQSQRLLEVNAERLEIERARLELVQRQLARGLCAELPLGPPPVTSRWWFWTIMGAASVGIAISIAVGATPPSSPSPLRGRGSG